MSLEQTNLDGKRPLHDAAQFEQLDCVKYLLRKGILLSLIQAFVFPYIIILGMLSLIVQVYKWIL